MLLKKSRRVGKSVVDFEYLDYLAIRTISDIPILNFLNNSHLNLERNQIRTLLIFVNESNIIE